MFEKTGGSRWRDLYLRNADVLWDLWHYDDANQCHLWTNDLHGEISQLVGALHSFAGSAFVLLSGQHLIPAERRDELIERTRRTLAATALRAGSHANWELCARPSNHPGMKNIRVQHCTGAPGTINALSRLPADPETDVLLLAAGDLGLAVFLHDCIRGKAAIPMMDVF